MRIRNAAVLSLVAVSALSLGACGSMGGLGLSKVTPDEFLTVSTAPLSIPPEYGLRPPAPGQPRAEDLAPEAAARQILLGQRQAVTRTPGEQALVAAAGADRADPLARYVIDDELGDLAHKDTNWANWIIGWVPGVGGQGSTTLERSTGPVTIDAASEQARLQELTGGRNGIVIAPRRSGGFKLPGL